MLVKQHLLKELLKISGLNKSTFAQKHGFKRQMLSEWIQGRKEIRTPHLIEICEAEGYEVEFYFKLKKL